MYELVDVVLIFDFVVIFLLSQRKKKFLFVSGCLIRENSGKTLIFKYTAMKNRGNLIFSLFFVYKNLWANRVLVLMPFFFKAAKFIAHRYSAAYQQLFFSNVFKACVLFPI